MNWKIKIILKWVWALALSPWIPLLIATWMPSLFPTVPCSLVTDVRSQQGEGAMCLPMAYILGAVVVTIASGIIPILSIIWAFNGESWQDICEWMNKQKPVAKERGKEDVHPPTGNWK